MGLTWSDKQRKLIESSEPLELDVLKIDLDFAFEISYDDCYPNTQKEFETPFANLSILNLPNTTFQTFFLSMNFDSVGFNRYSKTNSKQVNN